MFPECSGVYIAQREDSLFIVKVKGVYPTLQLDKKAVNLGVFLRNGKTEEVSQDILDNMELFHTRWEFHPLRFLNFSVFSKTEFQPNGTALYLSEEDILSLRSLYYRLCQQGVPPMKAVRAVGYELKVSKDQVLKLINSFDEQSRTID